MRARSLRSVLALVVAALALVVGGAAPASAHAYLASSSPADGTSLQVAPRVVELRFTEHVVLESTEVTITDTAGRRYAPRALTLAETDEDREAPATIVATLPALPVGAYHVAWRTLSSDDLHQSSGLLAFGVQDEVTAAGPSESAPDALETAGRWAVLSGLGLALGALLLCGRPLARTPDPRTRALLRARLWRLARTGAALAASAALLVTVLDLARFGTSAVTTGYAARWLGREAALVAVVALVTTCAPAERSAATRERLALAAGLVAALLTVALGHVGLRSGATWAIAATAHLAAACAWAGAVACLALLVLRHRREGRPGGELAPLLTGFRVPAVVAVVVVAVSGVYLASDVVVSVDAVLLTTYGRMLLAKLAVAALVGVLALRTTRAVHARRASAAVRPRVVVEAVGLTIVVVLGAVLASGQPAVSPRLVIAEPPSRIDDRPVADLQQTVVLRPNRPGASVAVVDVLDTRRPSPGPVTGVTVGVGSATASTDGAGDGAPRGSTPVPAAPVTRGRWAAGVTLPAQGPVDVRVAVHRRGLPDVVSTIRWVVGPDAADARVLVSKAPLAGPLTALAVVLALVAVAVALLVRRRSGLSLRARDRRPGRRSRPVPSTGRRPDPDPDPDPDPAGSAGSGPRPGQAPPVGADETRLLGSRPD
ncbi:copper resistance CopC family protein [Terrabacter sp. NPDC000476]|uniref:copper resistance CopC family protein n=1 Tax=Terrabacter sp. NPDC000476 TaxID=3154258 RepID=UPI003318BCCA